MSQPSADSHHQVRYEGTLRLLRSLPRPSPQPVAPDEDAIVLPRNHLLVLDHKTLTETSASLLSALTHPAMRTEIVLPELAVDCLDFDDKDGRRRLDSFQPKDETTQRRINVKVLQNTKQLLLNPVERRISFQRADQYDYELIREHKLDKKSYDLRLMVACARYFQKAQETTDHLTVILVSGDQRVRDFGNRCGVKVTTLSALINSR